MANTRNGDKMKKKPNYQNNNHPHNVVSVCTLIPEDRRVACVYDMIVYIFSAGIACHTETQCTWKECVMILYAKSLNVLSNAKVIKRITHCLNAQLIRDHE